MAPPHGGAIRLHHTRPQTDTCRRPRFVGAQRFLGLAMVSWTTERKLSFLPALRDCARTVFFSLFETRYLTRVLQPRAKMIWRAFLSFLPVTFGTTQLLAFATVVTTT